MNIPIPRRPEGSDEQTKFMQWVWDRLARALRFIDSPSVRWNRSAQGISAEIVTSGRQAAAAAAGLNWLGSWIDGVVDPAGGTYSKNDLVMTRAGAANPDIVALAPRGIRYYFLWVWTKDDDTATVVPAFPEPDISLVTLSGLSVFDQFPLDSSQEIVTTPDGGWQLIGVFHNVIGGFTGEYALIDQTTGFRRTFRWVNGILVSVDGHVTPPA